MASSEFTDPKDKRQDQILLVDDNPSNLMILFETLDGRGYKLLVADSGEKAISIVKKSKPDLVLLDVMMPGMDGFDVCRMLKQDPDTAKTSIVFLSALDDTNSKVTGFDAGGVDYISKPFQVREVIARVETHLKIHHLEQELELHNRQLQTDRTSILLSMSEGIYGLNQKGEIIFANPAACQINHCDESELLGKGFVSLHFDQHCLTEGDNDFNQNRIAERLQRVLVNRELLKIGKAQFSRPDKTLFPVAFHASASAEPDSVTRAVVVFHDISEELAQEAELAKAQEHIENQRSQLAHISRLSMMGEMAAGIAHEVNQPLTALANYVRLAKRLFKSESVDEEMLGDTLGKIEGQSLRASQVIRHIRDFVKKPTLGKDLVTGTKLVRDILELARIEAKELDIELVCDQEDELEGCNAILKIEEVQIQQVALNLIRNAMEAMKFAGMCGKVRFLLIQPDSGYLRFEVVDEGPGVTEDVQRNLFIPFTSTKESGMGIGLTLCQSIIHAHGGKIGYLPNPVKGSTFYFTLPTQEA